MLWSVALTLALDVERDVTAAAGPAPPPPCADDPGYFQRGQQFGQQIDWTSCTNWTGYTCATDAAQWGITDEADVAYLVRSCPVSCKDGPCNPDRLAWDDDQYDGLSSYSYGRDYSWDDTGVENNGECPCPSEWRGDGECDRLCNTAACNWDVHDCFHDDDGCYNHPTGADYRGNVSETSDGRKCQNWESMWPNVHTYTIANFPDAGMGGHHYCRNPSPEDGSTGPWCIVNTYSDQEAEVWGYCDVGAPKRDKCPHQHAALQHNHSQLVLGTWHHSSLLEHRYDYYRVDLPADLHGFEVVVVPETGDPNLYLSFEVPFPTGHNYTYKQDEGGVEVFYMTSQTYGYCGAAEASTPTGGVPAAHADANSAVGWKIARSCALFLSVTAFETSEYHLKVMDTGAPSGNSCAEGCAWKQLGDGDCQPQCNNTACFFDRGDCARSAGAEALHCKADCKADWVDDGYCDAACYNAKCDWDGADCGGAGCADDCLDGLRDNGECNAACNVGTCGWDGGDCFHEHHECYRRSDGVDYRGTVSHTTTGKVCQAWSEQYPNAHTRTHAKFPTAGLGGHNFCRNPDGGASPWCYTAEPNGPRFETCDVGPPAETCPPPPPPPPPRFRPGHHRLPPPSPAPPCPVSCLALFDSGVCDGDCNSTACLVHESCKPLIVHLDTLIDERTQGKAAVFSAGAVVGVALAAVCGIGAFLFWRHRRRQAAKNGLYTFGAAPDPDADPDPDIIT